MSITTDWHYPGTVVNANLRSPHWNNISNIANNVDWGCHNGDSGTGNHPHADISLAKSNTSDTATASSYGFAIPHNARIDGIQAVIIRSGGSITDKYVMVMADGVALSNKALNTSRSDGYFIVTSYGGATDKWGSNNITPTIMNDPNGLGLELILKNPTANSLPAWLHVMGLRATYTDPTYSLTSDLPTVAVVNNRLTYKITLTATNGIDQGVGIPVQVPIPTGFTLVSATSNEGSYDTTTHIWTPKLNSSKKATLYLEVLPTTTGSKTQTVTETEFNTTITSTCNIAATDSDVITVTDAIITDTATLNNLVDGETYTFSAYNMLHDANYSSIFAGVRNNRIAVVNGNEVRGSRVTAQNVDTRVSVVFTYDSSQQLKVRLYGQYGSVSPTQVDEWAGYALKQGYDDTYSEAGNLLVDPEALFSNAVTSQITLPAGESSSKYSYLFDNISQPGSDDSFFRGIMVTLDVTTRLNSGITLQLKSSSGNDSNILSKNFTTENTQIIFGGDLDLWGLTSDDLINQDITLEVIFNNIGTAQITPAYSNINLILYWMEDENPGARGLLFNGVHSRNYGMFLQDVSDPEGVDSDITTYDANKMDGSLPTSQDVKSKTVEVDFDVEGDTLEEAKAKLRVISQWLASTRNDYNYPTLNSLIFDMDPDKKYMVILNQKIDVDINYSTLSCKATFLIPSGMALSTDPVETGAVGNNNGISKARPVITISTDGSSTIVLNDAVSEQQITINHTITANTILTIDCENQTITDANGTDYIPYISLDTVWFAFAPGADYSIYITGGTIQNVSYYETY